MSSQPIASAKACAVKVRSHVLLVTLGAIICVFTSSSRATAQELIQVTWSTKLASDPVNFEKPASDYLPAFRVGLLILPESQMVALALSQPAFLGLTAQSASELQKLTAVRYQAIEADPLFSKAPSSLLYCFSAEKPAQGFAQVYVPRGAGLDTTVLLFIHGYGGSFLWYQHLFAEIFPNDIIICPAYGVTTAEIPLGYVTECLDAVARRLGYALKKPQLIGLSAGGFGACRIYARSPSTFARLLVIAAYPPPETIGLFDKRMTASFIVGGAEPYVTSGQFQLAMNAIRARGTSLQSNVVANADHFFLLSHQAESTKLLQQWAASSGQ